MTLLSNSQFADSDFPHRERGKKQGEVFLSKEGGNHVEVSISLKTSENKNCYKPFEHFLIDLKIIHRENLTMKPFSMGLSPPKPPNQHIVFEIIIFVFLWGCQLISLFHDSQRWYKFTTLPLQRSLSYGAMMPWWNAPFQVLWQISSQWSLGQFSPQRTASKLLRGLLCRVNFPFV